VSRLKYEVLVIWNVMVLIMPRNRSRKYLMITVVTVMDKMVKFSIICACDIVNR